MKRIIHISKVLDVQYMKHKEGCCLYRHALLGLWFGKVFVDLMWSRMAKESCDYGTFTRRKVPRVFFKITYKHYALCIPKWKEVT